MNKELIWIEKGYQTFAFDGPNELRIERLSKAVGKNKSSFYHHFADLDLFVHQLLDFHLLQVSQIALKEANANNAEELIDILIEHKIDFLFNRQLRIHREHTNFRSCFMKSDEISKPTFLPLWKKIIGLDNDNYLAEMVLMLSLENFFLQITDETLNHEWLEEYFQTIKNMVQHFKFKHTITKIDGSV